MADNEMIDLTPIDVPPLRQSPEKRWRKVWRHARKWILLGLPVVLAKRGKLKARDLISVLLPDIIETLASSGVPRARMAIGARIMLERKGVDVDLHSDDISEIMDREFRLLDTPPARR